MHSIKFSPNGLNSLISLLGHSLNLVQKSKPTFPEWANLVFGIVCICICSHSEPTFPEWRFSSDNQEGRSQSMGGGGSPIRATIIALLGIPPIHLSEATLRRHCICIHIHCTLFQGMKTSICRNLF